MDLLEPLALRTIANYVLQLLYTECQWKALPFRMSAKAPTRDPLRAAALAGR